MTEAGHGLLTQGPERLVQNGGVLSLQQTQVADGVGQGDAGLGVQLADQSACLLVGVVLFVSVIVVLIMVTIMTMLTKITAVIRTVTRKMIMIKVILMVIMISLQKLQITGGVREGDRGPGRQLSGQSTCLHTWV